jgi:DNA-binding NtrC family response regulator
VRDGRFREDLYYRLNTINIQVPSLRERREDIPVLFRKFAADFAQRYNMPTVRLTPEAQDLLQDYYFHGNIRQLKNIAEQISVIEQSREISVDILKNYLPDNEVRKMPVLFGGHEQESRSFNNEREILYQVLFDMKKDMDELRKVVHDLMNRNVKYQQMPQDANVQYIPNVPMTEATPVAHPVVAISEYPKKEDPSTRDNAHIEDTEEYVEETLSLEDMEKDVIKKALEKHRGKRKEAANELKISERTLYRKIKEYGIECREK